MESRGNLALRFRPTELSEVWGNKEMVRLLGASLHSKDGSHTFMFSGMRGCGKTSTARILAKMVGASEVKELNVADQRNIDDARSIIEEIKYPPITGGKRVYILDEIHAANSTWEDAMLKALEEPPSWVYFVLCTTDPGKVKKTIRSRCEAYTFEPLSARAMLPELKIVTRIVLSENSDMYDVPDDTLKEICEVTGGVPREALILLGQILSTPPEDRASVFNAVTLSNDPETIEICRALLNRASLKEVITMVNDNKNDAESVRRAILGYLSAVMVRSPGSPTGNRAANLFGNFMDNLYNTGKPGLIYQVYGALAGK